MLSMGDELGRTQRGNNNAYAQDTPLSWLDWAGADAGLCAFTGRLIALRRRLPALAWDRWLAGTSPDGSGLLDVEWRTPDGQPVPAGFWSDATARSLVAVLYAPGSELPAAERVWLAFNAGEEALSAVLPPPRSGRLWRREIDTGLADDPAPVDWPRPTIGVAARSVVVLAEVPAEHRGSRAGANQPGVLSRIVGAVGKAKG